MNYEGKACENDMRLQQTQRAGAGNRFRAALDLQLVKNSAVVPFDGVQGKEESFPDLVIGKSLGDELQDFELARGQRLNQRRSAEG